jgi:hypothetical protein
MIDSQPLQDSNKKKSKNIKGDENVCISNSIQKDSFFFPSVLLPSYTMIFLDAKMTK